MEVYCIQPPLPPYGIPHGGRKGVIYTYTGVGLSGVARFDKLGNARASTRGTGDKRLHVFCVYLSSACVSSTREPVDTLICEALWIYYITTRIAY